MNVFVPDSAALTTELKVPVEVPENVFVTGSRVLSVERLLFSVTVLDLPLVSEKLGFNGSVKSIIPVPKDSTEFRIPSLSESKFSRIFRNWNNRFYRSIKS